MIVGAAASRTEIVNTHVEVRPALSVAEQPSTLLPRGNTLPLVPLQVNDATPDPSVAIGVPKFTVIFGALLVVVTEVKAGGQVIVGAVVSLITIWK